MFNMEIIFIHSCLSVSIQLSPCHFHRLVRDLIASHSTEQIDRLLTVLGSEFALSSNPNARKGGLIALAAMAIGLGKVRLT